VTVAPTEVLPPGGVLYKVDSSHASFGELRRDTRGFAVLLAWITKLLRVRIPGSVNDPNVESLRPFEVSPTAFPTNVAERMAPMLADLAAAGFGPRGLCHTVVDLFNNSRLYIATLPRKDGRAVARVVMRTEGSNIPPKTHFYCDILSELQDGRFLWTTGAKATLEAPQGVELQRQVGAEPARLWTIHQQRLDCLPPSAAVRRAAKASEVREMIERHHVLLRDLHLKRKLFVPMSSSETEATAAINTAYVEGSAGGFQYPEILAEMERLQNKRTSWIGGLVVLGISLLLFVGAETGGQGGVLDRAASREMLLILVGVLFFHELGHWVAMKLFRYRNVRMFFIPFFGAAVSGTNYSAPGWKKVIVSLMGPVPGIYLGGALGIAGMIMHQQLLVKIALMSVILNGSNLIPVLPLDGGRVMQALLFSRHYAADVIFRALAAGALLLIALATGSRWFIALGVAMLLAVPLAWRLGRIAADLKREGLRPPRRSPQKWPRRSSPGSNPPPSRASSQTTKPWLRTP
jgi:Zn-dependent protease